MFETIKRLYAKTGNADVVARAVKKGWITEDDYKNAEKDIQKLTDDYAKEIDKIIAAKEKELTEI